jgi:hypothetical protein
MVPVGVRVGVRVNVELTVPVGVLVGVRVGVLVGVLVTTLSVQYLYMRLALPQSGCVTIQYKLGFFTQPTPPWLPLDVPQLTFPAGQAGGVQAAGGLPEQPVYEEEH